jgi:hypothetical protein
MIGERTAFWFITIGWITAAISGLLTAFLAWKSAASLGPANFVDAALLLGLAYGIFRKSRVCAILALIYYLINQAARVRLLHGAIAPGDLLIGATIFISLYAIGIIGTFAWHRRELQRRPPSMRDRASI